MPPRLKKNGPTRSVELNLNFKVPEDEYTLVRDTIAAILKLASVKLSIEAPTPKKQAEPAKARPAGPKNSRAEVGAFIRELRLKAGMSQKILGDKLGVRQAVVSLLEFGRQKLDLDSAVKLGHIFQLPYQKFMSDC